MDERRFISWIVVIGVPIVFLIWFFGYRGTIQFEANVPGFQIQFSNGDVKQCISPCLVRMRAGKKFSGNISASGFLSETFQTGILEILHKQIITFQLSPAPAIEKFDRGAYEIEQRNLQNKFPLDWNRMFGPPLLDRDGEFAIFAEKVGSRLSLKIMDTKGQEKLLNVLRGEFDLVNFRRNFILQDDGVVIPEKNNLYFYDFLTQKRIKVFEGPMNYFRNISVFDGEFLAQISESWYRFSSNSKEKFSSQTRMAAFHKNKLWEVRGEDIFVDGKKIFEIPQMQQFSDIAFVSGNLILQNDTEVWEVVFP